MSEYPSIYRDMHMLEFGASNQSKCRESESFFFLIPRDIMWLFAHFLGSNTIINIIFYPLPAYRVPDLIIHLV